MIIMSEGKIIRCCGTSGAQIIMIKDARNVLKTDLEPWIPEYVRYDLRCTALLSAVRLQYCPPLITNRFCKILLLFLIFIAFVDYVTYYPVTLSLEVVCRLLHFKLFFSGNLRSKSGSVLGRVPPAFSMLFFSILFLFLLNSWRWRIIL